MRGWWQDLTDLVLPAECGGCGRPRTVLCPECRAALSGAAPRRVRPDPEPLGLPVVHAAAPYEDEVRATLLAHKERGALTLATPLGTALAGAVRAGLGHMCLSVPERQPTASDGCLRGGSGQRWPGGGHGSALPSGPGPVLLVPLPSSRRAVRARGHDPVRRIALAAAGELRRTGMPARVLAVLRQRRAVADQAGLNSRQRLDNLAGALEVAAGGARLLAVGARVVLVDDLMTTGASMAEAARAVRAAVAGVDPSPDTDACADTDACVAQAGEATGERMTEATTTGTDRAQAAQGMAGVSGAGDMICAAVVAASPDSFEINRN
ncbi:ComF family protein [Streptomyces sp. NBC_01764]|uniref:ComF family protein n=1 Tax=Streptomyces sp. NBC_01764 TaxID=2975935 RepID=UPI0022547C17|nr:ComF family protein [Streptomyces sp. NBC_01764]MCX4400314.1 ComF family protein [Streptomyces sp. NBC_01764]